MLFCISDHFNIRQYFGLYIRKKKDENTFFIINITVLKKTDFFPFKCLKEGKKTRRLNPFRVWKILRAGI